MTGPGGSVPEAPGVFRMIIALKMLRLEVKSVIVSVMRDFRSLIHFLGLKVTL